MGTSAVNGWFMATEPAMLAGDEVDMLVKNTGVGFATSELLTRGVVVAPDGSYIGINPSTTGMGLSVFGHDCIAIGTAVLITGSP
jgi:hypothetical protein